MQENFAAQIKKRNRPGGKPETPGRPTSLMKQHYILSTMTRAGGNLPQNPTGRVYHGKVQPLPRFFPILAEKMHFFQKNARFSLQYSDFHSIMPLHPQEGAKPKPKEKKDMRTCFITTEEINEYKAANKCGVYAALEAICPFSAVKFARLCGGYRAFESWTDYEIFRNQK